MGGGHRVYRDLIAGQIRILTTRVGQAGKKKVWEIGECGDFRKDHCSKNLERTGGTIQAWGGHLDIKEKVKKHFWLDHRGPPF